MESFISDLQKRIESTSNNKDGIKGAENNPIQHLLTALTNRYFEAFFVALLKKYPALNHAENIQDAVRNYIDHNLIQDKNMISFLLE